MKNPLIIARELSGRSQSEISDALAVSHQFIQRLESGASPTCPDLVSIFYNTLLSVRQRLDIWYDLLDAGYVNKELIYPPQGLKELYYHWVRFERSRLPDLTDVSFITRREDFKRFLLLSVNAATLLELAQVLHLHPNTLTRYFRGNYAIDPIPESLKVALEETGKFTEGRRPVSTSVIKYSEHITAESD